MSLEKNFKQLGIKIRSTCGIWNGFGRYSILRFKKKNTVNNGKQEILGENEKLCSDIMENQTQNFGIVHTDPGAIYRPLKLVFRVP